MALIADFVLTVGDTDPPITAQFTDAAGAGVDVTTATVTFRMAPIAGGTPKVAAAATPVTPALGEMKYDWALNGVDTDTAGYFIARFRAVYPNGRVRSFPNGTDLLILIKAAV